MKASNIQPLSDVQIMSYIHAWHVCDNDNANREGNSFNSTKQQMFCFTVIYLERIFRKEPVEFTFILQLKLIDYTGSSPRFDD